MSTKVQEFLEPADAGRLLNLSGHGVRALADRGQLRIAARTVRGGRLFDAADVVALAARRARPKRAGSNEAA